MHMVLDLLFEEINDGVLGVMCIVQQKPRLLYELYFNSFLAVSSYQRHVDLSFALLSQCCNLWLCEDLRYRKLQLLQILQFLAIFCFAWTIQQSHFFHCELSQWTSQDRVGGCAFAGKPHVAI